MSIRDRQGKKRDEENDEQGGKVAKEGEGYIRRVVKGCKEWVRLCALVRIKPHAQPLVRVPVNYCEFKP